MMALLDVPTVPQINVVGVAVRQLSFAAPGSGGVVRLHGFAGKPVHHLCCSAIYHSANSFIVTSVIT